MSRRITLFVLLIFSLNFLGFYCYYAFRLIEIRKEARAQLKFLPESRLDKFTFSEHEYEKVRRGEDEIEVNGSMYDIAKITQHNDSMIVLALHDEAEDNLIAFLQTIVKRSASDKKPVPPTVLHLFNLSYLPAYFVWNAEIDTVECGNTVYSPFSSNYITPQLSPPPKS